MSFAPGDTVGGRYELVRLIGQGGVGVVWEAKGSLFGRVAVKLLRPHLASDPKAVLRFAAEAKAAATISHPNVVTIYDLGATSDKVPFFVMEVCDGETLDVTVAARGAMGVSYAVELVTQVLSALEASHLLGIVHRDLKPGNVMVVHPKPDHPVVKVLDFGIATRARSADASEEGKVFGTPAYMAPEQIMGRAVDERADIYSAGAILYELLTGKPPFMGRTEAEIMTGALQRPPKPIRGYVRTLPEDLDSLVRRCLSKDPAARPASASELREALAPFMSPPSRARVHTSPRERKQSVPMPLVRRADGQVADPETSEPALLLVKRPSADAPVSPRRAVLELVHDSIPGVEDEIVVPPKR